MFYSQKNTFFFIFAFILSTSINLCAAMKCETTPSMPQPHYEKSSWWFEVLKSIKEKSLNPKDQTYVSVVLSCLQQHGYKFETFLPFFMRETLYNFSEFNTSYLRSIAATSPHADDLEKLDFYLYYGSPSTNSIIQKYEIPSNQQFIVIQASDLHGDLVAGLTILNFISEYISPESFSFILPNLYLVITGDTVDRGVWSFELLTILMLLKIQNPNNVFILQGNHETFPFSGTEFGLLNEMLNKLKLAQMQITGELQELPQEEIDRAKAFICKELVNKCFKFFPSALIFKTEEFGNSLFCHGLPPTQHNIQFFKELLDRPQASALLTTNFIEELVFSDIKLNPAIEDEQLRMPQPTQNVCSFLHEINIFSCFRGHQQQTETLLPYKHQSASQGTIKITSDRQGTWIITTLSTNISNKDCFKTSIKLCVMQKEKFSTGFKCLITPIQIDRCTGVYSEFACDYTNIAIDPK